MNEKRRKRLEKMARTYMLIAFVLMLATVALYVVAIRTGDALLRHKIVGTIVPAICAVSLFFVALLWGYNTLIENLKKVETDETEERRFTPYKIKNKYYAPTKKLFTLSVQIFYCMENGVKKKYYYIPHEDVALPEQKGEKGVLARVYVRSNFIDCYEYVEEKRIGGIAAERILKVFLSGDETGRVLFFEEDGVVKTQWEHLTVLTEEEERYAGCATIWEQDAHTPNSLYENLAIALKENEGAIEDWKDVPVEDWIK